MTNDVLQAMQTALAAELLPTAPPHAAKAQAGPVLSAPDQAPLQLVEDFRPFSESLLWHLQRRFFEEKGTEAWSQGIVPHYVTSNSFIARAYAQVALGFLRDVAAHQPGRIVHLVELGAGVGQFGFHFLHWLVPAFAASGLEEKVRFRYVMTDFAGENVRFWQEHPRLRDWVASGLLDFARFDVTEDDSLQLSHSADQLSAENSPGPVFLIANYLFDTIPQSLYRLEGGQLHESHICLQARSHEAPDPDDPSLLPRLVCDYRHTALHSEACPEPALQAVIDHYVDAYDDLSLLFPHHGLRCLERFRAMTGGELFVLSGDKGFFEEQSLERFHLPGIAHHGSFSLIVNYHAFGVYTRQQGGESWFRNMDGHSITVCGFALADSALGGNTRLSWEEAVLHYGPDDFFRLKGGMERNFGHFQPAELLAYIGMAGHDPKALRRCLPFLMEAAKSYDLGWKRAFYQMLPLVMDNHYPIREAYDLEAEVAKLVKVLGPA